mgnify:FL=1
MGRRRRPSLRASRERCSAKRIGHKADVTGEQAQRTSKMWIGSASKNSCATIIVNSSSACEIASARFLERVLRRLTGWYFVDATPPMRLDRTEASTRELLALLFAHGLRGLDEVGRSHWRRGTLRKSSEGLVKPISESYGERQGRHVREACRRVVFLDRGRVRRSSLVKERPERPIA